MAAGSSIALPPSFTTTGRSRWAQSRSTAATKISAEMGSSAIRDGPTLLREGGEPAEGSHESRGRSEKPIVFRDRNSVNGNAEFTSARERIVEEGFSVSSCTCREPMVILSPTGGVVTFALGVSFAGGK